jgi:lambda repressor-like predicted transcriptional regulator
MRTDKNAIFAMRNKGWSFRKIEKESGISRSTLSKWFKNVSWSKHLVRKNSKELAKISQERMIKMNMVRRIKLDYVYAKTLDDADKDYKKFKTNPLFISGLVLYASSGEMTTNNITKISSTEFYLHRIFTSFSLKYLAVKKEDIRVGLVLYPVHDQDECLNKWSKELGVQKANFHKIKIILGKKTSKKLQYGIGMSIISSTITVKIRLQRWIELLKSENSPKK